MKKEEKIRLGNSPETNITRVNISISLAGIARKTEGPK